MPNRVVPARRGQLHVRVGLERRLRQQAPGDDVVELGLVGGERLAVGGGDRGGEGLVGEAAILVQRAARHPALAVARYALLDEVAVERDHEVGEQAHEQQLVGGVELGRRSVPAVRRGAGEAVERHRLVLRRRVAVHVVRVLGRAAGEGPQGQAEGGAHRASSG
jgi:hypothetical protein